MEEEEEEEVCVMHLKALGVDGAGVVRGSLQLAVHHLHHVLCVADVLQVPVGPQVQHLHGLADVLHLERTHTHTHTLHTHTSTC